VTVVAPDERELEAAAAERDTTRRAVPSPRLLALAAVAAALSLVAALVAAVGPAHGKHSIYSWPPQALPAQSPRDGWYAPLPLLNRVPAAIDIALPCGLSPPLRDRGAATVLATTRRSQGSGGLEIVQDGRSLHFVAGNSRVASMPWPASCPLAVSVRNGELRLPDRSVPLRLGTPGEMPIVTGLFTRLDIRHGAPPRVVVQTRDYATSQTTRQKVAALFSVLLACAALMLVAGLRRWRNPISALRGGLRSGWGVRHATDAVVVGALLLWWVIAPFFADDGWILVRLLNYSGAGGMSLYYDQFGANQPLGFWLEWSEHFLAPYGFLVLRLPALACLLAGWFLCRWVLSRSLPASSRAHAVVLWTLAATYLVGAFAWGMTLRPEPIVSLLTLIVLAAMLAFTATPRFGALAVAVPASALAIAGHTTGIVATAPLLAGSPAILRAVRAAPRAALVRLAALLAAGVALLLVLYTLDSDVRGRLDDAELVREGGLHSYPPWREYIRYWRFDENFGATATRHFSLVLLLLCVVALVSRRRSIRSEVSFLPARSIAVGLVVLAFVPSKWPWHFGALAGIGAVAVAAEVARLMLEVRIEPARRLRALVAVLVLTIAAAWSWTGIKESTPFDLEHVTWKAAFNLYTLLATAAAVASVVLVRRIRRRRQVDDSIGVGPGIAVSIVGLSAVVLTAAVVLVDTAVAPWSPARLNVEALVGRTSGCGLVDHVRNGSNLAKRIGDPATRSLFVPTISPYVPCATLPEVESGRVQLPSFIGIWFDQWPFSNRDSPFQAATDLYDFRRVAHARFMTIFVGRQLVPGFQRVGAVLRPSQAPS
jgi:cell wall arabinan synthesis protein